MTDATIDLEVAQIQASNLASMVGLPLIAIVEKDGAWHVHQHSRESVAPTTGYVSIDEAASRVAQLLGLEMILPQTWPEEIKVGTISSDGDTNNVG